MWSGITDFLETTVTKKEKKKVEFLRYVDCSGLPSVYKCLSFSSFKSVTTVVLLKDL